MSQSQPVIPVTMQYGAGGYGGQGQYHHLENEIHRSADHIKNDIQRTAEHTQADIQRGAYQTQGDIQGSKDYLGSQATANTNWVRGDISDSKDKITDDVKDGTSTVLANLMAQANADQAQTRASQIETRQAVERNADKGSFDANRNADYINNNVKDASISGLLATQNTSTAGLLATQNASVQGLLQTQQVGVATALAVQNTSSDIKSQVLDSRRDITGILASNFSALGVQSEKNAALVSQQILTQAQAVLLGQKDSEVNAANNRAAIQLQSADYKSASSLQASEYHKDSQLLAQQNFQATQLQAASFSAAGLLKTAESTAAIMAKLAECCCESKMGFANTQTIVMQNGTNNQSAIQQGQMNQLTQALAASQNEALMQRITNSVISTTTNIGSGTSNPRTG